MRAAPRAPSLPRRANSIRRCQFLGGHPHGGQGEARRGGSGCGSVSRPDLRAHAGRAGGAGNGAGAGISRLAATHRRQARSCWSADEHDRIVARSRRICRNWRRRRWRPRWPSTWPATELASRRAGTDRYDAAGASAPSISGGIFWPPIATAIEQALRRLHPEAGAPADESADARAAGGVRSCRDVGPQSARGLIGRPAGIAHR